MREISRLYKSRLYYHVALYCPDTETHHIAVTISALYAETQNTKMEVRTAELPAVSEKQFGRFVGQPANSIFFSHQISINHSYLSVSGTFLL